MSFSYLYGILSDIFIGLVKPNYNYDILLSVTLTLTLFNDNSTGVNTSNIFR